MASQAELLARDAITQVGLLGNDVQHLQRQVDGLELLQLRERVRVLEQQVPELAKKAYEVDQLRSLVSVLQEQTAEMKKWKEESDRRKVQFTVLLIGGLITLAISLLTLSFNLVMSFFRK